MSARRRQLFGLLAVAPIAATLPAAALKPPAHGVLVRVRKLSPEAIARLKRDWDAAYAGSPRVQALIAENSEGIRRLASSIVDPPEDPLAGLPDGPDNGGLS